MDSKAFSEDSDASGAEIRRLRLRVEIQALRLRAEMQELRSRVEISELRLRAERQELRAKNRQLRAKLGLVHSDDSSEDEVSCPKLIYLEKICLKGQLYNLLLIK